MKNKILITLGVFLASLVIISQFNCDNENWIFLRASKDYFALQSGNTWQYEIGGVVKIVKVEHDTVINNISTRIVTIDFQNQYWQKNQSNIKKLSLRQVNYNGNDYTIEQAWLTQYQLPFILGNSWSDTFADTVDLFGDTYYIRETITRQITAIEDVNVPAGSFFETYRIDFIETCQINDSLEYYSGSEWFAPGVGLIKRTANQTQQVLTEYTIK